jgi:ribokinase
VTPNETEAGYISGIDIIDDDSALKAANIIKSFGVNYVIITLGKRGALIYEDLNSYTFIPSFKVDVIDTTGAGDAFNGGFAHAIEKGMAIEDAVYYANAVAAISVTKFGTAPAMPTEKEIDDFLAACEANTEN